MPLTTVDVTFAQLVVDELASKYPEESPQHHVLVAAWLILRDKNRQLQRTEPTPGQLALTGNTLPV